MPIPLGVIELYPGTRRDRDPLTLRSVSPVRDFPPMNLEESYKDGQGTRHARLQSLCHGYYGSRALVFLRPYRGKDAPE